jgi:hypothetical protein
MKENTKEELIIQWKQIRANYFNLFKEDMKQFDKAYCTHPLYDSVKKHFDKSFREINQIAQNEIDIYLENI